MINNKKAVLVALLLQGALCIAFAITSFIQTGTGFKYLYGSDNDCPRGTGTDYLFKIKRGEGFMQARAPRLPRCAVPPRVGAWPH